MGNMEIKSRIEYPNSFKNVYNRFLKELRHNLKERGDPTMAFHLGQFFTMRTLPFEQSSEGLEVRLDEDGFLYIKCPDWIAPAFQEFWDAYQERDGITVDKKKTETDDDLTPREREIANYLAEGLTKANIAKKIMITNETVKTHCRNIRDKWSMNTEDTGELQRMAQAKGYGQGRTG